MALQNLRSSTANKRPVATSLSDGQIAINTNAASPGIFFKNSSNVLTKVGPIQIGTSAPNSSPAGSAGNAVGEQWLDTSGSTVVLKVWDGSAWQQQNKFSAVAGTAAAPSIAFDGDPDSGLFSPGANQVAVSTGGGERLRITSSGELAVPGGIGPQIRFENQHSVTTDAAISTFDDASGTLLCLGSNFYFNSSGSETRYNTSEESAAVVLDRAGVINFLTGDTSLTATSRMRITSAGLVGIGTSSPNELLHVVNSGSNGGTIQIGSQAVDGGNSRLNLWGVESYVAFRHRNVGGGNDLAYVVGGPANFGIDNSSYLAFGTRTAANVLGERVRITSAGRVGIGTTSPLNALVVREAVDANDSAYIEIVSGNNANAGVLFSDTDAATRAAVLYNHGDESLRFFRSGFNEAARIDSSGRLLVGTSSARAKYFNTTAYGPLLNLEGTSNSNRILSFIHNDSSGAPILVLGATGGSTAGSNTLISATGDCGFLSFQGADGSELVEAARIAGAIDGTPGANDMPGRLVFSTTADGAASPTERLRITSAGLVGIGTSSPPRSLTNAGSITLTTGTAPQYRLNGTAADGDDNDRALFGLATAAAQFMSSAAIGDAVLRTTNGGNLLFGEGVTERLRIDSSGRLLVGTSTARTNFYNSGTNYAQLLNEGTGFATSTIASIGNTTTAGHGAYLVLGRSRGAAVGSNTVVQAGDHLGKIDFLGADGSRLIQAARILCEVDGTPGASDMPGRLAFSTTADGASAPTERMRISSAGKLTVPGVYSLTTTSGSAVYVEADGDLLRFTSSRKYKTDIETIEDEKADAILECRPVWYRSLSQNDIKTEGATKSDWGWYGFIAEEVAEIDPRLVSWATKDAVPQEDGSLKSIERDPVDYEAEGVRYDNFVPLLLNLIKRQKEQIEAMESRLTALETA
jgi:hypothetical protein